MALLSLEPDSTLHFAKIPNATAPSKTLKLTNLHSTCVAFKVKTTAPKAYLVRPSTGTLRPRDLQEVQIILQPSGVEAQANNHRFLVQAVPVSSAEPLSRDQWNELPKDKINEQRLNVVLEELQAEPVDIKPLKEGTICNNPTNAAAPNASAPLPVSGSKATGISAGDTPADLKSKYEELVDYTLVLEKEKKRLEQEVSLLQAAKGASAGDGGYSKLQIMMVAVIAFLLSYVAKFLG